MLVHILVGGKGGTESFVGSVLMASFFSAKWEEMPKI